MALHTLSLLSEALDDQADLTAVERFAQHHDSQALDRRTGTYARLLPSSPPSPGEQYRFEVNLDACTGCKSCVTACNSLNGLDADEQWRTVGTVAAAGSMAGSPIPDSPLDFAQSVTSACHHCIEPTCLSGCPATAYEKDPITGIVRHLDDQCIGCSYCELTCPYEVPSFNQRLGIVRKCDMCTDRLAVDEAPACVQGCPTEAITIGLVRVEEVRQAATLGRPLVPGAASSALTSPTTSYVGRDLPTASAVELAPPTPARSHAALADLLVGTQAAAGMTVLAAVLPLSADLTRTALWTALAVLLASCVAGGRHLGRPAVGWRILLGWRTSWLSREAWAFGAWAVALGAAAAMDMPPLIAATTGVIGVSTSTAVYVSTGRAWWALRFTAARFACTTVMLGALGLALVGAVHDAVSDEPTSPDRTALAAALVIALTAGFVQLIDVSRSLDGRTGSADPLARTALLLAGPLARRFRLRMLLGIAALAATAAFAAVFTTSDTDALGWPSVAGCACALVAATSAELVCRRLFFTASASRSMPGATP